MRKRSLKQQKGQFIIIAVLFIATMIISIGGIMYTSVTYYKNEPWEEYLTLISNIELSSSRIVEISLSNYTTTTGPNPFILRENLNQWQMDLTKIYPGYGISLKSVFKDQTGIETLWNRRISYSEAKVNFNMNIESLGLTEYRFTTTQLLKLNIHYINSTSITVTVTKEGDVPVFNLKKENFQILDGPIITSINSQYDDTYSHIYTIRCSEIISSPLTLSVFDQRGIIVKGTIE